MKRFKTPPNPARCKTTGKARYRDRKTALAVINNAARIRASAEIDGVPTQRQERRVYRCPDCDGWHTTSKPLAPSSPAPPPVALLSPPSPEQQPPVTPADTAPPVDLPLKPYPTPNLLHPGRRAG